MLATVRLFAASLLLFSSLAACASSPAVFADGMTVPVSLVNRTGETICFLYLSPINDDSWTGDVLGSATVPEGATRTNPGASGQLGREDRELSARGREHPARRAHRAGQRACAPVSATV